jgi:hypothetical protein
MATVITTRKAQNTLTANDCQPTNQVTKLLIMLLDVTLIKIYEII